MSESTAGSDLGVGLAMTFGVLSLLGALATTGTGYLYALEGDHLMQLLSGASLALALAFAGLAIAALHVYE